LGGGKHLFVEDLRSAFLNPSLQSTGRIQADRAFSGVGVRVNVFDRGSGGQGSYTVTNLKRHISQAIDTLLGR